MSTLFGTKRLLFGENSNCVGIETRRCKARQVSLEDIMLSYNNPTSHYMKVYIDVGDGCWSPNVLVTTLRC